MNTKEIRTLGTDELETRVAELFDELEVPPKIQLKAAAILNPLKEKSEIHHDFYKHDLRVTLMAVAGANLLHRNPKPQLFGSYIHDNGKADIPEDLYKKHKWTTLAERQLNQSHVLSGYNRAKVEFPFSAEILLRHHTFQWYSYPSHLPSSAHLYSVESKKIIIDCSALLALIDAYDALHRVHFYKADIPFFFSDQEIEEKLFVLHADRLALVKHLYDEGVFVNADKVKPDYRSI